MSDLADACEVWQGGRDSGSSRLRGAARVLTGIPHYFDADFIDAHDAAARRDPRALERARVLLDALTAAEYRTASEWAEAEGVGSHGFAGRGVAAKDPYDDQIVTQLQTGTIDMPLWGVSLDPAVATSYGTDGSGLPPRWIFRIEGRFPAVIAWVESGIKAEEQELICGGRYRVLHQESQGGTTSVTLEFNEVLRSLPRG